MFQFVLSLAGRKKVVFVNVILNLFNFHFGVTLITLALYTCVMSELHPNDLPLLRLMFTMIACFGVLVVVVGLSGAKLSINYFNSTLRRRLGLEVAVWTVVASLEAVLGIGFMFVLPTSISSLQHHVQTSMQRGLTQYLQDSSWKTFFDEVQVDLECCGVLEDEDWRVTSWIPLDQVRENSRTVLDYTKVDGRTLPPVVPYSCCKVGLGKECLHDQLQQISLVRRYNNTPQKLWDDVYSAGCFPKISTSMKRKVNVAVFNILAACIIQLITIALSGYIYMRTNGQDKILFGRKRKERKKKKHFTSYKQVPTSENSGSEADPAPKRPTFSQLRKNYTDRLNVRVTGKSKA